MSEYPEWFERLKSEWPAAWEYDAYGDEATFDAGSASAGVHLVGDRFAGTIVSGNSALLVGLVDSISELRSLMDVEIAAVSTHPEWFNRLKAEWPAEWKYEGVDYGGECAVLATPSGLEVRVWGGEHVGDPCHAVIDSCDDGGEDDSIFVEGIRGGTFEQLRKNVEMVVAKNLIAWQGVAELIGGGGS